MVAINIDNDELESPNAPTAKRKKTAGERIFNRIVYTFIGFFVNEASSLWITDQFTNGRNLLARVPGLKKAGAWFSKEGFDRASEAAAKAFNVSAEIAKDGKIIATAKEKAGNSILMATLLSGGTLLLWPMKKLEDHKAYWVKKANHLSDRLSSHKKTKEEIEKRDAEVDNAIACSPRQSWPSMLLGRATAMLASWGVGTFLMGKARNDKLMDLAEETLTRSVQPKGQKDALHRYARLVPVETYSCLTSSTVLELSSKFCAKEMTRRHDPEKCDEKALQELARKKQAPAASGSHGERVQSQKDAAASQQATAQV